ncbi:MAG: hypothetical protein A2Y77_04255 [Planctomycetes bacterium RBG_13_62_9]|nr:MAG: hypothetical protein A2Y77_04255 [Planctomycetes bacterium RBG_13_62_9]
MDRPFCTKCDGQQVVVERRLGPQVHDLIRRFEPASKTPAIDGPRGLLGGLPAGQVRTVEQGDPVASLLVAVLCDRLVKVVRAVAVGADRLFRDGAAVRSNASKPLLVELPDLGGVFVVLQAILAPALARGMA